MAEEDQAQAQVGADEVEDKGAMPDGPEAREVAGGAPAALDAGAEHTARGEADLPVKAKRIIGGRYPSVCRPSAGSA